MNMRESHTLESAISEYRKLATVAAANNAGDLNDERLIGELASSHDWTEQGAQQLVELAQQYGCFFLRNALALAIALDIEEGKLGL